MILGYVNLIGIKVQQKRVTESLARFDPDGCHMRWSLIIRRKKYNVPFTVCRSSRPGVF